MTRAGLKQLLTITAVTVLAACQDRQSSPVVFDNYLYRLSNSLDAKNTIDDNRVNALLTYPKKQDIQYILPPLKINMLEFLKLSKCDLQRLIGERNSSLGKLMSGYHSLIYEYRFLQLAQDCLGIIGEESPLFDEVSLAIEYKTRYQQHLRWNAIFVSDEMRHLFSLGSKPLSYPQLQQNPIELTNALTALQQWLSAPHDERQSLEIAYQSMASQKYAGELRLTMAMVVEKLSQADHLLLQRLSDRPLCRNQRPNQQFDIVDRVFTLFYIGEVQPILAKLHQQGSVLFGNIDELQKTFEPQYAFTYFWHSVYRGAGSEWQRFNQAITIHTQHWQQLLRQCGRLPGL